MLKNGVVLRDVSKSHFIFIVFIIFDAYNKVYENEGCNNEKHV